MSLVTFPFFLFSFCKSSFLLTSLIPISTYFFCFLLHLSFFLSILPLLIVKIGTVIDILHFFSFKKIIVVQLYLVWIVWIDSCPAWVLVLVMKIKLGEDEEFIPSITLIIHISTKTRANHGYAWRCKILCMLETWKIGAHKWGKYIRRKWRENRK